MDTVRQFSVLALIAIMSALFLGGTATALRSCGGSCSSNDDCQGKLACINNKCRDDPDVGTHVCGSGSKGTPASSSPSSPSSTSSSCGAACSSNDDCPGQLACTSRKCGDDPEVGTHICSSASPPTPSSGSCTSSSYLLGTGHSCNSNHASECCVSGKHYPQFHCSPPVSSSTAAILTLNGFGAGADGGAPSECDNSFHSDSELIVALSTGWYAGGSRCHKQIRITASNGRSVLAKVVDECDTVYGCDADHDYQPPCPYNDVDASPAVWKALGISSSDPRYGQMAVTWADA